MGGLIKNARKHKRLIPEDTVWHFFYQIVLALHYCHTPHLKPGSPTEVLPNAVKRAPILHRDLKPENGGLLHRALDVTLKVRESFPG